MNTPTILLYNLDNPGGQNPPYVPVPAPAHRPGAQGVLRPAPGGAGGGGRPGGPYDGDGFDDEMLLIVNCPGPLLDLFLQAFRRQKLAPVRLKAVLTPTNREWDSVALHAELCRERQAIAEGQAAHRKGQAGE
ncbi:MAG: DUF3783 domain-containing protein [Flavonifractor plautii]